MGIFAEGLGAAAEIVCVDAAAEMMCVDTMDMDIVEFSDTAHIQELIVDQVGTAVNDSVSALANQSLIGILKASQNLSEPVLSEPDSSLIRPHEASLPVSVVLAKIRLSHHGDLLLEHGIETAEDLKDLSKEQAQEIGVTKVGELNRLKRWQESFKNVSIQVSLVLHGWKDCLVRES